MAFRIEAAIGAWLIAGTLTAATPAATTHLRHGGYGELKVTGAGISFRETGKPGGRAFEWKYEQIQQLELSDFWLRVVTYEDARWKVGRDREYVFDQLPAGFAKSVYPAWRDKLDQRFIAAVADTNVRNSGGIPAKLTGLMHGVEGTLLFGEDRIMFCAEKPGASRTWRLADIENIASAGRFDLSVVTEEREFRFQLQHPMEEAQFNELWRRVMYVK